MNRDTFLTLNLSLTFYWFHYWGGISCCLIPRFEQNGNACVCVCVCVYVGGYSPQFSTLSLYWNCIFILCMWVSNALKVKVAHSCPTLCNPMDCIVHGILQARILESVAAPFSRGSSQPRDQTQVSHTAGGFFTNWVTVCSILHTFQSFWFICIHVTCFGQENMGRITGPVLKPGL